MTHKNRHSQRQVLPTPLITRNSSQKQMWQDYKANDLRSPAAQDVTKSTAPLKERFLKSVQLYVAWIKILLPIWLEGACELYERLRELHTRLPSTYIYKKLRNPITPQEELILESEGKGFMPDTSTWFARQENFLNLRYHLQELELSQAGLEDELAFLRTAIQGLEANREELRKEHSEFRVSKSGRYALSYLRHLVVSRQLRGLQADHRAALAYHDKTCRWAGILRSLILGAEDVLTCRLSAPSTGILETGDQNA